MNFDKLYLVHTLGLKPEDLVVNAGSKIDSYLDYRYNKINNMVSFLKVS